MPEFFLELFSEEIPARMQKVGAEKLQQALTPMLEDFSLKEIRSFYGPRRIGIIATIDSKQISKVQEVRGPKANAPEAALAGFLGKHMANRDDLVVENGYYVLRYANLGFTAKPQIEMTLPFKVMQLFSWPKSMRWGQGGDFTWVRPLRRIVCLLDGEVLALKLGPAIASNETEGHRFMAPGNFAVSSSADWEDKLEKHFVIADQTRRRQMIVDGLAEKASALQLSLVEDTGLIDEVTGLVEWPVPLVGKIDDDFMNLPPEVRELSMKVNQRYFASRDASGKPAPYFIFISNIEAKDGGKAIISGNERVLRARLSDASHFWDLDLKTSLDQLLPKLDKIIFHAKIGTQGDRVKRISGLAAEIAALLNADENEIMQAECAGLLSKADLVSGMVGEFPELQGTMGGYYAKMRPNGWDGDLVGQAIRSHYQPKGPSDVVPTGIVPVSVALADKIDTLREFFHAEEKPSGSSDPYALRRAALGVIRIILDNDLRLSLKPLLYHNQELFNFIVDRIRVKLQAEGRRYDVLSAVLAVGEDDDIAGLIKKTEAVSDMLTTDYGQSLLTAYRRAVNILRIEETRDHCRYSGQIDVGKFVLDEERALFEALAPVGVYTFLRADAPDTTFPNTVQFDLLLRSFSTLRAPVDAFFERVTVNASEPEVRINRLRMLGTLREIMHQIADFSKIEG